MREIMLWIVLTERRARGSILSRVAPTDKHKYKIPQKNHKPYATAVCRGRRDSRIPEKLSRRRGKKPQRRWWPRRTRDSLFSAT